MLKRHSEIPIYIQLAETIRKQISSGIILPGDKLPSESEMQKKYGVARLTVREALSVLVNEGLLEKKHGKGTFCRNKKKISSVDVLLNMSDYYFIPYYIQSISNVLDSHDVNFIVGDTKDSCAEIIKLLNKIIQRGSDGVILQASPETEFDNTSILSTFENLNRANIPLVQIDAAYDTKNFSYVIMNEEKIGEIAAKYLLDNGHKKIATVLMPNNRISDMRMKCAKKIFDQIYEINSEENLVAKIQLAYKNGVSAIYCFNDDIAKKCYDSIVALNLSVPHDISLISVDDTAVSKLYNITSVSHAKGKLGEVAASSIVKNNLPIRKVFEPVLTERLSVKKLN